MITAALAKYPTPILNRPDFFYVFGGCSQGIFLDRAGLLKPLEMIAFPGEIFTIIQKHPVFPYICEVAVDSYPIEKPLYVDERFLQFYDKKPLISELEPPLMNKILSKMEALIGKPYVWGGNYSQGIENMLTLYPPKEKTKLTLLQEHNWMFKGVDCSGMLYEATQGFTPRNTSWLASYGEGLIIEGLSNEIIESMLKPLDMIIWHGHVVFVLNDKYMIESRAHVGHVFVTKISERLKQIKIEEEKSPMNSTQAVNYKKNGFVIRRWYPEFITSS